MVEINNGIHQGNMLENNMLEIFTTGDAKVDTMGGCPNKSGSFMMNYTQVTSQLNALTNNYESGLLNS